MRWPSAKYLGDEWADAATSRHTCRSTPSLIFTLFAHFIFSAPSVFPISLRFASLYAYHLHASQKEIRARRGALPPSEAAGMLFRKPPFSPIGAPARIMSSTPGITRAHISPRLQKPAAAQEPDGTICLLRRHAALVITGDDISVRYRFIWRHYYDDIQLLPRFARWW